jgi:hypothetical protein
MQPDPSLIKALARAFGGTFYVAGVFKLGQDLLGFVGPQLLSFLIVFVSSTDPAWHGYGLAVALFAAAELQSILLHQVCISFMRGTLPFNKIRHQPRSIFTVS